MAHSKVISRSTYLKALALFTAFHGHYRKAEAFTSELADLLGYEDSYLGCISDVAWEERPNFDKALAKEGFTVKAGAKKRK